MPLRNHFLSMQSGGVLFVSMHCLQSARQPILSPIRRTHCLPCVSFYLALIRDSRNVEHTCWAVAALRPCVDRPIDSLRDAGIPQAQVRWLVVVVVCAAAVERVVQRKCHLPVWPRVLPRCKFAGGPQRFMVGMPEQYKGFWSVSQDNF